MKILLMFICLVSFSFETQSQDLKKDKIEFKAYCDSLRAENKRAQKDGFMNQENQLFKVDKNVFTNGKFFGCVIIPIIIVSLGAVIVKVDGL